MHRFSAGRLQLFSQIIPNLTVIDSGQLSTNPRPMGRGVANPRPNSWASENAGMKPIGIYVQAQKTARFARLIFSDDEAAPSEGRRHPEDVIQCTK